MMSLCCDVLRALQGKTLATAESCTGGGIGHAITAVSGSSAVFKGGIISYCDEIKANVLGVSQETLDKFGAVSAPVAEQMARGACRVLNADIGISATGLADSAPDDFGHPGGTVFIGYADAAKMVSREFHFSGTREEVRNQTIENALMIILEFN